MKTTLPSTQAWSAVPFHHVLPPCQVPLPSEAPLALGSHARVVAAWAVPIASSIQDRPRTPPSRRGQKNRRGGLGGFWDKSGFSGEGRCVFIRTSSKTTSLCWVDGCSWFLVVSRASTSFIVPPS